MKFSEIKTGDVLYLDGRQDWANCNSGKKATVVDGDRLYKADRWWRASIQNRSQFIPVAAGERGGGVLVERPVYMFNEDRVERTVVPMSHLRGPYKETAAAVKARSARRQEQRLATQEKDRLRRQAEGRAVESLEGLGLQASVAWEHHGNGAVKIGVDDVELMVSALESYGWKGRA